MLLAREGRVDYGWLGVDAFGNALGAGALAAMKPEPERTFGQFKLTPPDLKGVNPNLLPGRFDDLRLQWGYPGVMEADAETGLAPPEEASSAGRDGSQWHEDMRRATAAADPRQMPNPDALPEAPGPYRPAFVPTPGEPGATLGMLDATPHPGESPPAGKGQPGDSGPPSDPAFENPNRLPQTADGWVWHKDQWVALLDEQVVHTGSRPGLGEMQLREAMFSRADAADPYLALEGPKRYDMDVVRAALNYSQATGQLLNFRNTPRQLGGSAGLQAKNMDAYSEWLRRTTAQRVEACAVAESGLDAVHQNYVAAGAAPQFGRKLAAFDAGDRTDELHVVFPSAVERAIDACGALENRESMAPRIKVFSQNEATAGRSVTPDSLDTEAGSQLKGISSGLWQFAIGVGGHWVGTLERVSPSTLADGAASRLTDGLLPRNPLISRGVAAETGAASGPIDLMRPGDQFLRNAANRLDVDPRGLLDVVAHGNPMAVEVQGQVVNHRVLARLIVQNPQFVGQDIRLLSCSTGGQANGLAQNLANKLGVQVTAPSDTLWAFPSGRLTIGPTPVANTGRWITFGPGGRP